MYCLTIDTEEAAFRHVVVKIEWPRLTPAEAGAPKPSLFLDYFCIASPLWLQTAPLSASLRIDVGPETAPVTWHGFTAERNNERLLHQLVAALMRIDGVEGAVVTAAGDLSDFRAHYTGEAREWLSLDTEPLSTSLGGEFFNATRMVERLGTLLASAVAIGHEATYQAVFRPSRPDPDILRRTHKAAAFLRRQPGVPAGVVKVQTELAARLDGATFIVDEAVSISRGGEAWLERWLNENTADQSGNRSAYSLHNVMPLGNDGTVGFANHIHPDLLFGTPEDQADPSLIPRFWKPVETAGLFRCEVLWRSGVTPTEPPPFSPLPIFFGGDGYPPPRSGKPAKAKGGGSDPFFFVSYAHKDANAIKPILDRIRTENIPIWIDEQIKIGEEWDTRLETMITTSTGLLVFLSPHYVASKHCRRELKFADALDKEIFASALAEFPLESGFGYIFASLQYATGTLDKVAESLAARLRERLSHTKWN